MNRLCIAASLLLVACASPVGVSRPKPTLDAFVGPNNDSGAPEVDFAGTDFAGTDGFTISHVDAHSDALSSVPDAAIPRTGLIGEWLFSDNLNDTSGNGGTGTATGATFGPDRNGVPNAAAVFDGLTQYISVPNSTILQLVTDITISAWINPTQIHDLAAVASKCQSGGCATFTFRLGNGAFMDIDSITYGSSAIPAQFTTGKWTHVLATESNGVGTIYINGTSAYTSANGYTVQQIGTTLRFGVDYQASFFAGSIDDIRIYSRVLSVAEIVELANEK